MTMKTIHHKLHAHRRAVTMAGLLIGVSIWSAMFAIGQGRERLEAQSTDATTWAAEFPSPGAVKVFENDRVIVWDKKLTAEPYMHKHTLDSMEILLEDGPVRGVNAAGRISDVRPNVANEGKLGWIAYIKAGMGPHSMIAADVQKPARLLYIELKGTEPATGLVNGRWPK